MDEANVATATGVTPGNNVVTSTDSADVTVLTPDITLVKLPASQTVEAGETVTFTLRVTRLARFLDTPVEDRPPLAGTEQCARHCLDLSDTAPCDRRCAYAPYRRLLGRMLRGWEGQA